MLIASILAFVLLIFYCMFLSAYLKKTGDKDYFIGVECLLIIINGVLMGLILKFERLLYALGPVVLASFVTINVLMSVYYSD